MLSNPSSLPGYHVVWRVSERVTFSVKKLMLIVKGFDLLQYCLLFE
jgi:hypothetical protein